MQNTHYLIEGLKRRKLKASLTCFSSLRWNTNHLTWLPHPNAHHPGSPPVLAGVSMWKFLPSTPVTFVLSSKSWIPSKIGWDTRQMGRKVWSPERVKINRQHREEAESEAACGAGVQSGLVGTRTGARRRDRGLTGVAGHCFQAKRELVACVLQRVSHPCR